MLDISPLDGIRSPFGQRRGGGPAPAFSPSTLYSSGAQGIWLDPSDLFTMFSDRAGTTPVTTPGTVVGLRLDKSKGLVLGSELVTNGTFDANVTGWSSQANTTISWVAGELRGVSSTTSSTFVFQDIPTVSGVTYRYVATVRSASGNVFLTAYNGAFVSLLQSVTVTAPTTNQTVNFVFTATGSSTRLGIGPLVATTFFIDNISVRELQGNHAVAPTDAARPIYGVEPKGGRRNLLTWSEDQTNSAWTKAGVVVTADQSAGPVSGSLADRLLATSSLRVIYQTPTLVVGQAYTLSAYVKRNAATDQGFLLFGNVGSTASPDLVATDSWQRFQLTFTATGTGGVVGIADNSVAQDYDVLVYGVQLELGSTATNYQRVTTAYDITESGVATCHYVQYDGSDDSLSTSSIDFTATDKMSVFAGVRKLSDAGVGMLVELSSTIANSGTFLLDSADNSRGWLSMGRGGIGPDYSQSAYVIAAAPDSAVLAATHDIAGDLSTIRRNAVAGVSGTADKGTGNFGNYPLFIGRRNNTSLPFNGLDYGLIVVGKAASAGEIADTETWLAARTAQVTL